MGSGVCGCSCRCLSLSGSNKHKMPSSASGIHPLQLFSRDKTLPSSKTFLPCFLGDFRRKGFPNFFFSCCRSEKNHISAGSGRSWELPVQGTKRSASIRASLGTPTPPCSISEQLGAASTFQTSQPGRGDRWKGVRHQGVHSTQNSLTAPRLLQVQPLSCPQHPQGTSPIHLNPPALRNSQEKAQQRQRARKCECWGLRGVLCLGDEQKGPDYCHHPPAAASWGLPAINPHHNHWGWAFWGWAAPRGSSRAGTEQGQA